MNILDVVKETNFIIDTIRVIGVAIDVIIYKFLSFLYRIFYWTSKASILDENFVEGIIERVTMIIGIVMLFSVAISAIKYVVDPDKVKDAKIGTSKLVIKILVCVFLLASVSEIFGISRRLQELIIDNNVIFKIVTGKNEDGGKFNDKRTGNDIAVNLLFSFLNENDEFVASVGDLESITNMTRETAIVEAKSDIEKLNVLKYDIKVKSDGKYYYKYDGIISSAAGIFFCFILITYTFSIGVRVIQLAFLQIIAPVPIISYVLPNGEEKLKTWVKQCVTTYLDLFIRIFIMATVLEMIKYVQDNTIKIVNSGDETVDAIVLVVVYLAILMFAKKAPDLIKELFPGKTAASGDFGLSLKNRFKDNMAGTAIGGIAGGLGGFATGLIANKGAGKISGALGGLGRGVLGGLTGKKTGDIMKKTADKGALQRQGVGSLEQLRRNVGNKFGAETEIQRIDRKLKDNALARQNQEALIARYDSQKKLSDQIKEKATATAYKKNLNVASEKAYSATDGRNYHIGGNINKIKETIEQARNSGSSTFTLNGNTFDMQYADNLMKDIDTVGGKLVVGKNLDNNVISMIKGYEPAFIKTTEDGDIEVDVPHLYDSFSLIKDSMYDAQNDTGYTDLLEQQKELERQKARIRGQ